MVMKSAVDDDDTGWVLGIPEKMKNNANWVDITHEFKGACKGNKNGKEEKEHVPCVLINIKRTNIFCLFPFLLFTELNLGELLHDKL